VYKSENHYKDFLNAMRKRTKPICDVEDRTSHATVCNIGNMHRGKTVIKMGSQKEKFKDDAEANALWEGQC
jgi:hypothetical protein